MARVAHSALAPVGAVFLVAAVLLLAAAPVGAAPAEPEGSLGIPVESFRLDNGMTFLVARWPGRVTVSAGWVAHVGSADERPGTTGVTHLLEHLLFKGSRTVGARDAAREALAIAEEERLAAAIREAYGRQRQRFRAGEIDDPFDPGARPPELVELERRFEEGARRLRLLAVGGDFHRLYSEAGATGMNARTLEDLSLFFVTLPANKLELWFWLESDRLLEPVFRDFYTERRVVEEERRQRIESTPTGLYDEELQAMFWQSHPYGRPVSGWPSDLAVVSRADAERHFAAYYGPGNLTAALVGELDPEEVRSLARRYFGRLERRPAGAPEVTTLEVPQRAEKRLLARCRCRPQVRALYHTVPFGHPDADALEVLAGLLNGRTGRLHKSLVLEQEIAFSAHALQEAKRWAGLFSVAIEAQGETPPEALLAAWDRELDRLRREPVPAAELAKVGNQITADALRRLREPSALMAQLLIDAALGDPTRFRRWTAAARAVTAGDLSRVVERYFDDRNRAVGLYDREAPGGPAGEPAPPATGGNGR